MAEQSVSIRSRDRHSTTDEASNMKTATRETLDVDELFQLALRASQADRHEDALSYLKRALALDPDNGKIHYMLGAEHAQIGLYDRAVQDMARAVELDPELHTAQFQLGLLHITAQRVAEAEAAWKPLDKLGKQHPLYLFKAGMLHLARDEFSACVQCLREGIKLNTGNLALNNDMQRILNDAEALLNSAAPAKPAPAAAPADKTKGKKTGNVFLAKYKNELDEKDEK